MDVKNIINDHNIKNELKFNEKDHEYSVNGEIYESVTQRISKYFPFNLRKASRMVAMKNWISEEEVLNHWEFLKNKGNHVHLLAELFCKGKNLSDDQLKYVKHVKNFLEDHEFEIISSEKKIFSKKMKLAGTVDLIARREGKLFLIDWKTSKKEIDKDQVFSFGERPFNRIPKNKFYIYSLQLSTYRRILNEEYGIEVWEGFIVHLKDDQTYRLIEPVNMDYEAELL